VFHKVPREQLALAPNAAAKRAFPFRCQSFYELSFSNFPLLYSSRSGVTCHPQPDAAGSVLFSRLARLPMEGQTRQHSDAG